MAESQSYKGLIYSGRSRKEIHPQIIPWIMGISKFGRRAVGGSGASASPSRSIREEISGLLCAMLCYALLCFAKLCHELADIIREFANVKFNVFGCGRAQDFACKGID